MQSEDQSSMLPMNDEISQQVCEAIMMELVTSDAGDAMAIMQEASLGNAPAQYIVGNALESLDPPRYAAAEHWFRLAAEQSYMPAAEKLRQRNTQRAA